MPLPTPVQAAVRNKVQQLTTIACEPGRLSSKIYFDGDTFCQSELDGD